jgi:hypothetical protein
MADIYLERGIEYVKTHPNFEETLNAAHAKGLDMAPETVATIRKNGWPEVAHYLAQNFSEAHRLMGLPPSEQVKEVTRLQERIMDHKTMQDPDTDLYLREQKKKIRNGERGRF